MKVRCCNLDGQCARSWYNCDTIFLEKANWLVRFTMLFLKQPERNKTMKININRSVKVIAAAAEPGLYADAESGELLLKIHGNTAPSHWSNSATWVSLDGTYNFYPKEVHPTWLSKQ